MSCQNHEKLEHADSKNAKQQHCHCNGRCHDCKCRQGLSNAGETKAVSEEA